MSAAPGRLAERLERIYAIGGGPGANRPAFTGAEDEAHELVAGWMAEAGLDVSRDPVGNLFGRRHGLRPELPEVWTGSHLDSVPRGGRYDGPLGVLAGLEAVAQLGGQERTLAVVAFRDEEGWRFGRGCFGSRALCGVVAEGELEARDADGIALRDAVGNPLPPGGWLDPPPAAYVELHVEQGPALERLGAPLGLVSSIAGIARLGVTFHGRPGHAGTTPMAGRADALVQAASFVLAVRDAAVQAQPAVATVGRLTVAPGAANVIPERVTLVVDARAPEAEGLSAVVGQIEAAAGNAEVELYRRTSPVPMSAPVQEALAASLADLGLAAPVLPSGAGHDAGVLGAAGVPAGMLFVRSRAGGVSHAPEEHSDAGDIALAVAALSGALRRLASSGTGA